MERPVKQKVMNSGKRAAISEIVAAVDPACLECEE